MNGVNRVTLLGSLGAKPELRHTQGGTAVLNMRLATNERYQNKDKEWVDRAEWHSIVCFGRRAEGLATVLDKGSSMLVEGSLRTSSYEKDGEKRWKTEIILTNACLVGGKRDDDGEEPRGNNGDDDGGSAPPARGGGQRAKQAPRQPSGGSAGGDDFEVRYGNDKGKMMTEVTDLSWLRGTLVKDLADASKSRFHGKAQAQLAAIDAELARRGSGGGGGASRPARNSGGGGYAPRGGGRQAPRAEPEEDFGGGGDGGNGDPFDSGGYSTDDDIPF